MEQRSDVALLKSNLSPFSRPAGLLANGDDEEGVLAAATLAQPVRFLELL